MSTTSQATANRANSQYSTGPVTPEGKAASSRNAVKHGLASRQLIIQGEDPAAYEALLDGLTQEHAPATVTEQLLVTQLAQSFWFMQRCIRLHQDAFARVDMSVQLPLTSMPLLVRYESAVTRAFHKSLSALLAIQKTRRKDAIGFVSQTASAEPAQPAPPAPAVAKTTPAGPFTPTPNPQNSPAPVSSRAPQAAYAPPAR